MIHDNNRAAREITAHHLIYMQDRGKSICDFIINNQGKAKCPQIQILLMIRSVICIHMFEYPDPCEALTTGMEMQHVYVYLFGTRMYLPLTTPQQ